MTDYVNFISNMSNIAVLASVTAHIECACFDRQEFTQAPEANDSQL
jgi:hypothetical protein